MLTVDLGNSRLKACLWEKIGGALRCAARWDGAGDELAVFDAWLSGRRSPLAALASVAAPERTERVRALVAARCAQLWVDPDPGLECRCREPWRVGADRLYAASGAATLLRRSCIVVDAGTALTVDAVLAEGATRVFLGGAIAPGPALAAEALAAGTARLPRVQPRPAACALGTSTEEAIQAGVVVGFRGAAECLVEGVAEEARLQDASVVLTGGAREFLLAPRPFTARKLEVVPDLVHEGLLAALLRVQGARPSS